MRRLFLATIVLFGSLSLGQADNSTGSVIVDLAEQAIQKGYGTECTLEFKPSRKGGYYPCLDFGPYRYVKGYGKSLLFVIQEDKEPFQIMGGTDRSLTFLYDGPWATDVAPRLVIWWNEIVEGNKRKFEEDSAESRARVDAEEYIRSLNPQPDAPESKTEEPRVQLGEDISTEIEKILQR